MINFIFVTATQFLSSTQWCLNWTSSWKSSSCLDRWCCSCCWFQWTCI